MNSESSESSESGEPIVGSTYRILSLLGKGGMGNVYLAEHLIIGKHYALKMLAPEQVTEENWNRFQIEGKAIARLDHPNIVKVYNMGVDKTGVPFYVMDLLPGDSLQELLKSGKTPDFDSLLSIFLQIASALDYSHSRGVIHRDVKPSNIMLVPRGQATGSKYGGVYEARLVDFGIAKMVDFSDADKQRLTATGQVFGTPFYMSPEQCLGNSLDARSDIYSFGCAFFQALTGRPPFQGETALETVMMHLHEEPPTLEEAAANYTSPELESLVAKLLLKDRERRYGSMGQVIHDLERIRAQKPIAGAARSLGFESSARPSARDERDETLDSLESANGARANIALLLAGGVLLLLLLAVPCFYLFAPKSQVQSKKTVAMDPLSSPLPDESKIKNPERKVADLASFVTDSSRALDKKMLDYITSGSKVTFSLSPDGKKKIIHCPPFPVGKLRWCTTGSPKRRFDLQEDGIVARGDVPVPADKWTILSLDTIADRLVWQEPAILRCFDGAGIVGVRIAAARFSELEVDNSPIVEALQGWSELRSVALVDGKISEAAWKSLDAHKTLQELSVYGSSVKAASLSKLKCLQHLSILRLNRFDDLSDLLPVLTTNKVLESIYISGTSTLPAGKSFAALRACKGLALIELSNCRVTDEQLDAIADNLHLFSLRLIRCEGVNPKKVLAIAGKHKGLQVVINVPMRDFKTRKEFEAVAVHAKNVVLDNK